MVEGGRGDRRSARRRRGGARRSRALERRPEDDLPRPGRRRAVARSASRAALRAYRCEGTSMKINLAVDQLPQARRPSTGRASQPYHRGIMEINPRSRAWTQAQAEARAGRPAADPHIELCIPTVHDPSLAPEGNHVVTIDVNSQPYTLAEGKLGRDPRRGRRPRDREARAPTSPTSGTRSSNARCWRRPTSSRCSGSGAATRCTATWPSTSSSTCARSAAGPTTGRRSTDLWLCGAGTHPGGGVTGANGRNCAREVIRERAGVARARLRGLRR